MFWEKKANAMASENRTSDHWCKGPRAKLTKVKHLTLFRKHTVLTSSKYRHLFSQSTRENSSLLKMFATGSIRKVSFRFSTNCSRRLLTSQSATIKPWTPVAVRPQNPVVDDPPSDPKGVTGILSSWVKDVQLNDIPKELIERSKHILLDGIGETDDSQERIDDFEMS